MFENLSGSACNEAERAAHVGRSFQPLLSNTPDGKGHLLFALGLAIEG